MGDEGDNLLCKRLVRKSNQSTGACVERKNIDKKGVPSRKIKLFLLQGTPFFLSMFVFLYTSPCDQRLSLAMCLCRGQIYTTCYFVILLEINCFEM